MTFEERWNDLVRENPGRAIFCYVLAKSKTTRQFLTAVRHSRRELIHMLKPGKSKNRSLEETVKAYHRNIKVFSSKEVDE